MIAAFALGFVAQRIRLPPLVGYLAAGFVLHALGYETTAALKEISNLGVLVLLFAIGLKLKIVILSMSDHEANLEAVRQVRAFAPDVAILATAMFADEAAALRQAGATEVRNLYAEVGQGLADDALGLLHGADDDSDGHQPEP